MKQEIFYGGNINVLSFNSNVDTYQTPEHVKVAHAIRSEVGDRLEVRHKMKIVAEYGALFDKINELGFRFQATGPKTKEELREILIDCAEELVNTVNQTEGILQHLGSYPFTYDKVSIAIFLHDNRGNEILYPQYCTASFTYGKLRYYTNDKDGMAYKTTESETYEEALKALGRELPPSPTL